MVKDRVLLNCLLSFILLLACTASPHPQEAALREAYERANRIALEAELSGDTSRLAEAFSNEKLKTVMKSIREKSQEDESELLYEETEVEWVKVIEYHPPEAVIEVKYFYRTFSFDRKTGERTYYDNPYRYWRIWKMKMIQEDGAWKVDEALEFVDWSG